MTLLDSTVAVVTDAADSPQRSAVVAALLDAGARVVVAGDRGAPGATDGSADRLTAYRGDVRGRGVEDLLRAAAEQHGRLDLVVLSTGEPAERSLADLDDAAWAAARERLDTLLWGVRASLSHMVPQGSGRVVVTLGAEAKTARPGAAVAVTVDHAAYGLVKAAAKEAGPAGVTVNAVLAATSTDGSLTGRRTDPEEVAAAVVLLASPAGGGMSAVAFPVDGGVAPY